MGRRRPPARDGDRSHGDVTRPGPRAGGQGPGRTRTVTGGDRAGDSGVTCHRDGHGDTVAFTGNLKFWTRIPRQFKSTVSCQCGQ